MPSGLSSTSSRTGRAGNGRTRLAAIIAALALIVGGVTFGQGVGLPEASALGTRSTGVFPVKGWYPSSHQISSPLKIDRDSLYAGSLLYGWGTLATGGVPPTSATVTPFGANSNPGTATSSPPRVQSGDEWTDTIAVDVDRLGSRGAKYGYSWDFNDGPSELVRALQTVGVTVPSNVTNSTALPLFRIKDGGTQAEFTAIPLPDFFGTLSGGGAYRYWSGGEVIQQTGQIMFSGAECSSMSRTFDMMIFDPYTGEYNYSGLIKPKSPSDDIFGAALNPCPGAGYVSSDMALDADGDAYVLVSSSVAVPAFGLPAGARMWLVRIVPSWTSDWTYELVAPLAAGPGQGSLPVGTGTDLVYGLAFFQGSLYALNGGATRLVRINPMSGQVFNIPPGTAVASMSRTSYDLASGQTAIVLQGTVYNDTGADGSVAGDDALPGQTVALYMKSGDQWVYQGQRTTNSQGHYSFLLGGDGDYIVRLVQPKIGDVNAVQTYASGGGTLNPVVAQCVNGNITTGAGLCAGAKAMPAPDPALPTALNAPGTDATTQPDAMAAYTTVKITSAEEVANADFAVTTRGSYGDAAAGPAAAGAPVHINGVGAPTVFLGDALGAYPGPATDNTAHNATDDGVYLVAYPATGGKLPLAGTVLASTRTYTFGADVSGPAAASAKVAGWATGAGNNTWTTAPKWSPTISGNKATGPFQFQPSGATSGNPAVQFRVNASTAAANQPTNAGGEYQAGAAGTPNWVTPGEVEDYLFTVADAVYRPAAKTTGGTGTFTVAGASITASTDVTVGPAKGVAAGTPVNLTASAPNSNWSITAIEIRDTETGAVITTPAYTVSGNEASFAYTPTLGSDAVIEVTFTRAPDPALSTLTVDPAAQTVGQPITATATVLDSSSAPLENVVVTFGKKSNDISLSGPTCTTSAAGTCSITVTSDVAKTYPDEITATVIVAGAAAHVSGSPATVTFNAGGPDLSKSTFTVAPVANPADSGTWRMVDEFYTGTFTARDTHGNLITNLDVGLITFTPSTGDVTVSSPVVGNGDGTYTATFTSRKADPSVTAQASYAGSPVTDAAGAAVTRPIPFRPGAPDPTSDCSGLAADPAFLQVGGTSAITAKVSDKYCNMVPGVPVTFTLQTGSAGVLTVTAATTDATGLAYASLTDSKVETVHVGATIKVGATDTALKDSPVAVTFTGGDQPSATLSTFTVSPQANPADKATWVKAGGSYTGTYTAKDQYGNLMDSLDVALISFQASTGDVTVSSPVVNNHDGTYTATFTSTKADPAVTARVAYGGQFVMDSPTAQAIRPIPFRAGDPAPENPCSSLVAVPAALQVGGTSNITATISDAYCNMADGVVVTFSLVPGSSGILTVISATTDADGKAYATLTDTAAETVSVNATVRVGTTDTPVKDSPVAVVFSHGTFDPLKSTFAVSPVANPAQPSTWMMVGSGTYTGTLTARDATGNVVPDLDVAQIHFTATSPDITVSAPVVNAGGGTYTVTFSSNKTAPTATAQVAYAGVAVLDSPGVVATRPVPFRAGAVDPNRSQVTVDPNTQTVGLPVYVIITAKDSFDNPLPGIPSADLVVSGAAMGGLAAQVGKCVEVGPAQPGVYRCEMTARLVGAYTVTAVVSGVTLADRPVATFTHGGVCVSGCDPVDPTHVTRFEMVVNNQLANGSARDSARAWAYDTYGNAVPGAAVRVTDVSTGALAGFLTPAVATATTAADGTATVEWSSTKAGVFTGEGTVAGLTPVTGVLNQIRFTAGKADPAHSDLVVTPAGPITVGNNYTLTVIVRDSTDNLLVDETVSFSLSPAAGELGATTCETLSDGTCSVTATAKLAGSYQASATVAGPTGTQTGVRGSPATLVFVAGPVCVTNCAPVDPANKTRVEVSPNGQPADGVTQDIIRVFAFDRYGNPVSGAQVSALPPATLTLRTTPDPVTGGDGRALLGYTATTTGSYPVPVTVDGLTPAGSPAQLIFGSGLPDWSKSTLTISPAGPQHVDSFFTVVAHVVDTNLNPIQGAVVTFPPVANLTFSGSSCTTAATGDCQVQVTSAKAATYVIAATGSGYPLANTVSATFTPGPICVADEGCTPDPGEPATRVEMVVNGVLPDGVQRAIARVYAYDRHGNPVPDAVVTATSANAALVIQPDIAPTGANGQSTIWYSSLQGGTYPSAVAVGGKKPAGSPVSVIFGGVADPAKSSWTITPGGPLTVGQGLANTYTASALLLDANGVAVPGAVMTFVIDPAGPVFPGGASCQAGSDGRCTVAVHSTVAGTFGVSANTAGNPVRSAAGRSSESVVWTPDEVCAEPSGCTPVDPNLPSDKRTRVVVTTDGAVADGDARDFATVYAFDKWGNAVPGQLVLSTTSDADLRIQTGIAGTGEQGTSTIWYASTKAGPHVAEVTVGGKIPSARNFDGSVTGPGRITVNFVPGDPSAAESGFTVAPAEQVVGHDVTLTATIRDAKRNLVPGASVAFTATGSGKLSAATATTNNAGVATVTLTDDTAETVTTTASVRIAGVLVPVTGSPKDVRFFSDLPDPLASKVTVAPVTQTAGSPVVVTVTVRDSRDNPITGLALADFQLTGRAPGLPDLVFTGFTPGPGGVYTFTTTSKLVGVFTIRATVKGVLIADAPTVTFTHGYVCVSNCDPVDPTHRTRIEMVVNDQLANGTAQDQARGYAYDTNGNVVTDAVFTVTDVSTGALAGFLTPAIQTSAPTGAMGSATVAWTSVKAGSFTALTQVRSGDMTNSIEVAASDLNAIRFAPGNISATRSELTVTPGSAQPVGQTFTATAHIVDANGNPLSGVTVSFSTGGNPKLTLQDATCETTSDGTCSVTATSVFIGSYPIHATVPVAGVATPLGGGGDPARSSPQTVTFFSGPVCVLNCTPVDDPTTPEDESATNFSRVEVTTDYQVANGTDRDTMTVYAYDRYGNPVSGVTVTAATTDVTLKLVTATATTAANGTARIDATSTQAGTHPATVQVASLTPRNASVELHFVPGPVGGITLAMTPTGAQEAGAVFTISATVTDASGNPVAGIGLPFTLPPGLTAVGGVPTCTTSATGECTLQVTATKTGSYPVTAGLPGTTSNTVTAVFTPGPVDGSKSTAVVTHDGEAFDGIAKDYVTVTAIDRFGNPVQGAQVGSWPSVGQSAGLAVQPDISPTDAGGVTLIWYTSTQAGPKLADVKINNSVTPSGSPVTLNFGSGLGDPDKSSWVISPVTSLTVGEGVASQFTLTATVHDFYDQPVQGSVVTFRTDKTTTSWGIAPRSCTTSPSGVCSVTVTSTKASTYAFTAALAAGQIGQARSAVWTADAVCGPCSTAEVTTDHATADGKARNIVTVQAFDQYDNPVPGQLVASATSDAGLVIQTGIGFTNDAGVSTIWYSSVVAGAHQAGITLGSAGATPAGSPVTLNFDPGPVSAEHSQLTVAPITVHAGELVTATAVTRDAHDNIVPGVVVRFGSTGSSTRSADSCTTGADGTCQVTVTDETAETVQVSATVEVGGVARGVKDSPATVFFTHGPPGECDDPTRTGTNLSVAPAVVEVPGSSVATAYITDRFCNAVGAGYKVDFTSTGQASLSAASAETDSTSRAVVTLSASLPTTATVSAKVGALVIKPSPVTVRFVDTTAPSAPVITGPKPGLTGADPVVVTGTGEPGAKVEVRDSDGSLVCETGVGATGTWTCSHKLADGDHTLVATQTDPSGNTSPGSDPVAITVDTTPPGAPVIDKANREEISGTVPAPVDPGTTVTVKDPAGHTLCEADVAADGSWRCPTPATVTEDTMITVTATDPAGNTSTPVRALLDVTAPVPPTVNPSNGSEVTGRAEPGSTVVVRDEQGNVVPGCGAVAVDNDGRFACTPVQPVPPGTKLAVTATDPAGNPSAPTWVTTVAIAIELAYPSRFPLEVQTVTGLNFNPGEQVCLDIPGDPATSSCRAADATGRVSFTFTVPDLGPGVHTVMLTGAKSGSVSTSFTISQRVVTTGGYAEPRPAAGAPAGLLALLVAVAGGVGLARGAGLARRAGLATGWPRRRPVRRM